MADVAMIFWDVGGVLLTNGWDRRARRAAAETFGLDLDEFEYLHESTMPDFELGRLDLDEYLRRTVFHRDRPFTFEAFRAFVHAQSQPKPDSLAVLRDVAASRSYQIAMLNNESRALNLYRIRTFGLDRLFHLYFSSCFLGVRKPSLEIYERVLDIVQLDPARCLLIDDRAANLEYPAKRGWRTIRFTDAAVLRRELIAHGIAIRP
jgi:putative hydrolase of the HAD superfamily